MIEAVVFDWSETLVHFEWSDELLAVGHRAGFETLGRGLEAPAFTGRFQAELLPGLVPGDDYAVLLRSALGVDGDELQRFLDAEWNVWSAAHALVSSAHALLETLRARGLRLALVTRAWPESPRLARRRVEQLGVSERVDVLVIEEEHEAPALERALLELDVASEQAVFVGDRLGEVQVAASLGMTTVQALWFRADDTPAIEPDFQAFTPMDVLNVTRRLEV